MMETADDDDDNEGDGDAAAVAVAAAASAASSSSSSAAAAAVAMGEAVPMDGAAPVPAWPGNDAASDGSFCAVEADEAAEAADKMATDKTTAAEAGEADKAAEAVAAELASMGFTDEPVVRFVIDRNHAELEACARELATLSEWDESVGDLVEMGFDDVALNKRLLIKHGGSVKAAV